MPKPSPRIAMQNLIDKARSTLPFDLPEAQVCDGICNGCSKKLLDYLDGELLDWQMRLDRGEIPKLGELSALGRTSLKIYRVVKRNGLIS
ncbi:hypothetical protein GCM10011352_23180 [Marinobacterium zhoushanense]|uniref:DUF1289 domain-containing protein n=1 Tax=Marinobacterium zhoushanense TaxID=1679163 RepID=A0ABQ1KF72_9GAMM|nr:hypothetical protein [Marinobacterium zhoushanense]GGB96421.1 hypothetical protein GCM10011352_23180 [Marinobacterium zhoushanense]